MGGRFAAEGDKLVAVGLAVVARHRRVELYYLFHFWRCFGAPFADQVAFLPRRSHERIWGIGTIIHYPIPPHLSEAYAYLGMKEGDLPITEHLAKTVLSIPIYNGMTQQEQTAVIEAINAFV